MVTTSIPCPIGEAAARGGGVAAIAAPDRRLDYRTLDAFAAEVARRLRARGVAPGTRVAWRLPNGWRTLVLLAGVLRAGAAACPLSVRLPSDAARAQARRVGAALFVTGEAGAAADAPAASLGELIPEEAQPPPEPARYELERPATVVFTSGSTGDPKAAVHTVGNHYYSALGSNANIPLETGDRWLLSLPLYHVGGMAIFFRCMVSGATVVLPGAEESVPEAAARAAATHVSLVSTQLRRWLRGGRPEAAGLDRLRAVLLGGSAIPPGLLDAAYERGLPVHTSYGLTEMSSQVTATAPGAPRAELATSGRVLPHRELRIGPDGEIQVRGRSRFLGYLRDDGSLERPFDDEGWFRTGDLGTVDDAGLLHVQGRRDHLFISGGENIQPEEIEAALCRLEGVVEAVVVPVADAEFGQRPVAYVRLLGRPLRGDELAAGLEASLPRFKVPVAFYPWPADLPEGMKVDRAALRRRVGQRS